MDAFGRFQGTRVARSEVRSFKKGILIPLALAGSVIGGAVAPVGAGALTTSTGSKATVVLNGRTYTFKGGACVVNNSKIAIGIGTGQNSLGISAVVHNHKFAKVQIGLIVNGQPAAIPSGSGTVRGNSGTFKGTDVVSGSTVTGTFSC